MTRKNARRPRTCAVGLLLAASTAAMLNTPSITSSAFAAAAAPRQSGTSSQAGQSIADYAATSDDWRGGALATTLDLGAGRTAWIFGQSLRDTLGAGTQDLEDLTTVDNSVLVETQEGLTTIDPDGAVAAFFDPGGDLSDMQPAGAFETGSEVSLVLNEFDTSKRGQVPNLTGTWLATLDRQSLTVVDSTRIVQGSTTSWGTATITEGSYRYFFGSEFDAVANMRYAKLARADLTAPTSWEFWSGAGWSSEPEDATRLIGGVSETFGVQKVGASFIVVSGQTIAGVGSDLIAFTSASLTGPYTGGGVVGSTDLRPGSAEFAYNIRLQATGSMSSSTTTTLLASYSVGDLEAETAEVTRPRFVSIGWPRPSSRSTSLGPVTGVTASTNPDGSATLTWSPGADASQYWVLQRDTTAGQSGFARHPAATTGTTFTTPPLVDGHDYEFRVQAANGTGDSAPSATSNLTVALAVPAKPAIQSSAAKIEGSLRVAWASDPFATGYEVWARDTTIEDEKPLLLAQVDSSATSAVLTDLAPDHPYETYVVAQGVLGASPASTPTVATPAGIAPAPASDVVATAGDDGTIALRWSSSPTAGVDYIVDQRDVTEGQPDFTTAQFSAPTKARTVVNGLEDDHAYEFQVRAADSGGESAPATSATVTATYGAPATPDNVTAIAGDGTVTLAWDADPRLNYVIYQRDVSAGESEWSNLENDVTTGSTEISGLDNAHVYEFSVASTYNDKQGARSATVSAFPLPTATLPVADLTITPKSNGDLYLAWERRSSSYSYLIFVRDVTAGEEFHRYEYPNVTGSFTANYLTNGHLYAFKIQPVEYGRAGPMSDVVQARSTIAPPAAPTNLTARSMGNLQVRLDWDGPSGVHYWVYTRNLTLGETTFTKSEYPTDTKGVTLGSLRNGHRYEFKMRAENLGGLGPASGGATATATNGTPEPPTGLTGSARNGAVQLSWTRSATSGASYVVHQRDATSDSAWFPVGNTSGASYLADQLFNGRTYQFKVTATNANGESRASGTVTAKPMPPSPEPASGLRATAGNAKVALVWSASSTSGASYWIEYKAASASRWTQLPYPVSTTSFTVQPLRNAARYHFRVVATNLSGESAPTAVVGATPMPPVPQAPTNLRATVQDRRIQLTWTASTTADVLYLVEYRRSGASWIKMPLPTSRTRVDVLPLINGTRYEFRVRTNNRAGSSPYTSVTSAVPLPPAPTAPSVTVEEGWAGLELKVNQQSQATHLLITVRNLETNRSFTQRREAASRVWLYLEESIVWEVTVRVVNARGTGPASTADRGVPEVPWFNRHAPKVRTGNALNGANGVAISALNGNHCNVGKEQVVCFGRNVTLGGKRPATIGDYLAYPHSEDDMQAKVRCEADQAAELAARERADPSGQIVSVFHNRPYLLEHEALHSEQEAKWPSITAFFAAYLANMSYFEDDANNYWGQYDLAPGVRKVSYQNESCNLFLDD